MELIPHNAKQRREFLEILKGQFAARKNIIHLKGQFKLTKTENSFSDAFLYYFTELETQVRGEVESRIGYGKVLHRYSEYDPQVNWVDWPRHYPVRVVAGNGPISCGKNIFAFFPEALRLLPKKEDDVFGIEFIDVWEKVFNDIVFPCSRLVFDTESLFDIYSGLQNNLSRIIYLAAVFHEVGHRVGPWKVSPQCSPHIKMNSYHWGILGEISTDSLLVSMLSEFHEISYFVTLQRLFWFGRRGTSDNPLSGFVNQDNDAWLGSFLWNRLQAEGAVSKKSNCDEWHLSSEKLSHVYRKITLDIDHLAEGLPTEPEAQDCYIDDWMKTQVEWRSDFGFVIPQGLRQIFEACYSIPDSIHFVPPFSLAKMREHHSVELEVQTNIISDLMSYT